MGERSVFGTVLTFLLICLVGAAELLLVSGCQPLIGDSPEQAFERLKKAAEEKIGPRRLRCWKNSPSKNWWLRTGQSWP